MFEQVHFSKFNIQQLVIFEDDTFATLFRIHLVIDGFALQNKNP
jgi:hypothetical protein